MIRQYEIQQKAVRNRVSDTQIEKDYIISWLLFGITQSENLSNNLIFKGGTALKKIYFPDYRYSEDLDFTMFEEDISFEAVLKEFRNVSEFIYNQSRIQTEIRDQREHQIGNYRFFIHFVGPLGRNMDRSSVKVDIARDEIIIDNPIRNSINSDYSDLNDNFEIQSYSIDEILSEKLRSLIQRTIPRDLYDTHYLLEVENVNLENVIPKFIEKMNHKNLELDTYINRVRNRVRNKERNFQGHWQNNLVNQIHNLPNLTKSGDHLTGTFVTLKDYYSV